MHRISIIYHSDDAAKWCVYLQKLLSNTDVEVDVAVIDVVTEAQDLSSIVDRSSVVALMVSPSMVAYVIETNKCLMTYLQGHAHCVIIDCFLDENEKEEVINEFPFTKSFKLLKITLEKEVNLIIVSELVEELDGLQQTQISQRNKEQSCPGFCLVPSTVYEQTTPVYINFQREIQGRVTVGCCKCKEQRITAEAYNPYTAIFTPEGLGEGVNRMCVFVDDKQVGEGDLYFTPHTLDSYESPRFVCQLLGINPDDTNAMDERLTNMCQESMPDDQSLNSLLGTNMSDTPQESRSGAEIPTLLHFAAHNGLSQLCSLLLNIPGSMTTYHITNRRGLNPYHLAMEAGFPDLAQYIKMFLETAAIVHACDTLYLNVNHTRRETQSNQDDSGDVFDDTPPPDDVSPATGSTGATNVATEYYEDVNTECHEVATTPQKGDYHFVPVLKDGSPKSEGQIRKSVRIDIRPPEPLPKRCSGTPVSPPNSLLYSRSDTTAVQVPIYHYATLPPSSSDDVTDKLPAINHEVIAESSPTKSDVTTMSSLSPQQFMGMSFAEKQNWNDTNRTSSTSGSSSLDELTEIGRQARERQFTIDEAERLYRSWQERNRKPSLSMRQKQQNLQELREQYQNVIKAAEIKTTKLCNHGILALFRKRLSKRKVEISMDISSPICEEEQYTERYVGRGGRASIQSTDSGGSRDSEVSSRSRDSTLGASLVETDAEGFLDDKAEVQLRNYSQDKRKDPESLRLSLKEQFLRSVSKSADMNLPPPIPPRKIPPPVPPKTF